MKNLLISICVCMSLVGCNLADTQKSYTFILKDGKPRTLVSFKHYANHTVVGVTKGNTLTVQLKDSNICYVITN